MPKYIAILRGINVGGKRKLQMQDLKDLFIQMGFQNPQTYIQSGNVAFSTGTGKTEKELAGNIENAIYKKFNYSVPVIIRSASEIDEIISSNPYLKSDIEIERLHLSFLSEAPETAHLETIKSYDFSPDDFKIEGNNVYVFCSGKYSDSKLSNNFFESKLKVKATTRNWKTVLKLSELAKKT